MLTRREALRGIGVAVGAATLGCGTSHSSGEGEHPDAAGTPDGDVDAPPGAADASPADAPPADACAATSSMTAAQLLAGIDTIVVLCMENRSFDHYLGSLKLVEGRAGVDGLTGNESNPAPSGPAVVAHPLDTYTPADPPHDWNSCHTQWNSGANDGFVKAHAGSSQADVMGYYVRSQIPITYALADQSAMCERWFAAVMGPTWPNRFYLHCATSGGQKSNLPSFGVKSIFAQLADAKISSMNWFHDVAWAAAAYGKVGGNDTIEKFFAAAKAGTLPSFSIIDPHFIGNGANDDHPSHDVRMGQALIASVVNAMAQSPHWPRSLLVVTYDEHGGFFDHVPPPTTVDERADFQQLGFRVPTLVVGPTVRRGCTIDTTFEHSSIAATVAARWGLTPLNDRAKAAADLSACIDPGALDSPHPPPVLPTMTISKKALAARPHAPAHEELLDAIAARPLPPHLDRRADADGVTARFLDWAERLGAVTLVD